MAGASAGSIIAVCHHSGLSTDVIAAACLELAEDCRNNGTRGRLGVSFVVWLNLAASEGRKDFLNDFDCAMVEIDTGLRHAGLHGDYTHTGCRQCSVTSWIACFQQTYMIAAGAGAM